MRAIMAFLAILTTTAAQAEQSSGLKFAPEERCYYAAETAALIVDKRDRGFAAHLIHASLTSIYDVPSSIPRMFPGLEHDLDVMVDDIYADDYMTASMAQRLALRACGWKKR